MNYHQRKELTSQLIQVLDAQVDKPSERLLELEVERILRALRTRVWWTQHGRVGVVLLCVHELGALRGIICLGLALLTWHWSGVVC